MKMKHLLTFVNFTVFALNKLRQFVDSRKELTAQSYRFFVEHAYNQFFQHEAFHQSARARTKVKECGSGDFHIIYKARWLYLDSRNREDCSHPREGDGECGHGRSQ